MRYSIPGMISLAILLFLRCGDPAADYRIIEDELKDCKVRIAKPAKWKGRVLLLAHGMVPAEAPLDAGFDEYSPVLTKLLAEGWIIAATSYRRNGAIVREAAEDLDNLRQKIEKTWGTPEKVFLMGSSMGGAIVTLIAETMPDNYSGALAIGAALGVKDTDNPYEYTHDPKIPLLFLTNQSEIRGPAAYVEQAKEAAVRPALWTIARTGHCNTNVHEEESALMGLVTWELMSTVEYERDATIIMPDRETSATFTDTGITVEVTRISAPYGNIMTDCTSRNMAKAGIGKKSYFNLTGKDSTFRVFYGETWGDVPKGEWIAFSTADEELLIARNWANANQSLQCAAGDRITLVPDTKGKE